MCSESSLTSSFYLISFSIQIYYDCCFTLLLAIILVLQWIVRGLNAYKETSSSDNNNGSSTNEGNGVSSSSSGADNTNTASSDDETKKQASDNNGKGNGKNNGRNPHTVYEDANIIWHRLDDLHPGSPCPKPLCTGKLTVLPAGVIVVIDGQSIANVTKHHYEKYRCNLCHYIIKAKVPTALEGKQKMYTAEFKAHLAMHKFFLAVPYHRMDTYQRILNCPLPDSTQWDLIQQLASSCYPIFRVLKLLTANSKIIYNDDTVNRILEVIAENKRSNKKNTGMHTTCIMAETEDGHKIALYLNGTLHSGQNLDAILDKRDKAKKPILQMSDALAANTPSTIATIACYCLSHGFRKIEYLDDYFPLPCISMMKKLGKVFAIDAKTKTMSDDERLAYHIVHSKPIMFALYEQIDDLLNSDDVEPNGELAKALRYFKNHWVALTRFLTTPGAPIDNNIVERALKLAIRVRKNSLFYKSRYSAELSGMLTSLIYTCTYINVNPVIYLTALQKNGDAVQKNPHQWLPWNFDEQLEATNPAVPIHATAEATVPPLANPAATQSAIDLPIG